MKKRLISVLALLLCLCMLAACGGETPGEGTTDTTTPTMGQNSDNNTPSPPPEEQEKKLELSKEGKSDYRIVISADATEGAVTAAYDLRWVFKTLTGVDISIVEDTEPVIDTEIVIGSTNRHALFQAPDEKFDSGYAAYIRDRRIILDGGSADGIARAVKDFVQDCFGYDIYSEEFYYIEPVDTLLCRAEYERVEAFIRIFEDALRAAIIYDGTYMQKRLAYVLRDNLVQKLKVANSDPIPQLYTSADADKVEGNRIEMVVNSQIEAGTWRIEVEGDDCVRLIAKDYYGFEGGARQLSDYFARGSVYVTGDETSGDYRDTLTNMEQGSAYAFDQQSEYRVMFYNVLWIDAEPAERDLLNVETIGLYRPDVLGLQEVNNTKRGKAKDGKGGLIAELEKIGYAEAVDPRVRNAYATNTNIPGTDAFATTGANEGQPLKGYGTSGATQVTVDGETFHTFFNCAPLFYNTKTTRLIEAEYYWYKNQWDKRAGQSHSNSAMDCASKAATWGVFEDLETGDRYIAISTHMCTRSDYIKGLQAQEILDLIAELVEKYDCPVLFGGDYNGNYNSTNFLTFEQNGLVDVEKNNLASIHTSKVKSYHRPYPAFDKDKGCVQPTHDDDSGAMKPEESVDHIMITNVEEGELEIFVYGVVIDETTKSGADHFPVFMDFSIHAAGEV